MSSTISSSSSSHSSSSVAWMCNKSLERKVRKPKIEKLRRARINTSLEKLKEILLHNTIWRHTQGARPTKLEKADILEMSVRYIEMLHDKLSTEKPSSSSKLMEKSSTDEAKSLKMPKAVKTTAPREIFGDVTNQIAGLNGRRIINDDKLSSLWLPNRFNLHQRNFSNVNGSDNLSDKENLLLNKMRQFNENLSSISTSAEQSIFSSSSSLSSSFEERHWRPWW